MNFRQKLPIPASRETSIARVPIAGLSAIAAKAIRHLAWLIPVFAGACAVGPDYRRPSPTAPERFLAIRGSPISLTPSDDARLSRWWRAFGDPILNRLIRQAFANNLDLKVALARVDQARAGRHIEFAQLFPHFGANATAARFVNPFPGLREGVSYNIFQLGFDAVWEIDAFGQQRRQIEAASANLELTGEQYRQALVTLAADVARAYIEYRSLEHQLAITRANVDAQAQTLELTETLLTVGVGTGTDVVRARAQVKDTQAEQPTLESQRIATQRQLEVLLGQEPGTLDQVLRQSAPVPVIEKPPILAVPAQAVRHRPDIRASERNLAAGSALYAASVAELYPKLSLPAFFGLRNTQLATLFRNAAISWAVGNFGLQAANTLATPILNFGQIRAQIDQAKGREREAYFTYQKTVLEAFREIETTLSQYLQAEIRRKSLAESVGNLRKAVELTRLRYEQGASSFLDVLEAQRVLFVEEIELARTESSVSTNLVAVHKALGGGWDTASLASAISQAQAGEDPTD